MTETITVLVQNRKRNRRRPGRPGWQECHDPRGKVHLARQRPTGGLYGRACCGADQFRSVWAWREKVVLRKQWDADDCGRQRCKRCLSASAPPGAWHKVLEVSAALGDIERFRAFSGQEPVRVLVAGQYVTPDEIRAENKKEE